MSANDVIERRKRKEVNQNRISTPYISIPPPNEENQTHHNSRDPQLFVREDSLGHCQFISPSLLSAGSQVWLIAPKVASEASVPSRQVGNGRVKRMLVMLSL